MVILLTRTSGILHTNPISFGISMHRSSERPKVNSHRMIQLVSLGIRLSLHGAGSNGS